MSTVFNSHEDRLVLIAIIGGLKSIRMLILDQYLQRYHPDDPFVTELDPIYNCLKTTGIRLESKIEIHSFLHHLKKS